AEWKIGRRSSAAQRSATAIPPAGSLPREYRENLPASWEERRCAGGAAPPQRRHSMATNSARAELPVVASSVPAISPRSTLRNDAASMNARALQEAVAAGDTQLAPGVRRGSRPE